MSQICLVSDRVTRWLFTARKAVVGTKSRQRSTAGRGPSRENAGNTVRTSHRIRRIVLSRSDWT